MMMLVLLGCFPFRLNSQDQQDWAERKAEIEALWGDTAEEEYVETIVISYATVNWGPSSVTLDIGASNVGEVDLHWGLVETAYSDSWSGEDCFKGDYLSNGDLVYRCHPIHETGKTLYYGADPANILAGEETVFQQNSGENMTYIITNEASENASCWVWGHDISYYDDYYKNCIVLN